MSRAIPIAAATLVLALAISGGLRSAAAQDLERGETVYEYWCAACHGAGANMPGTQALQIKYAGSLPAVLTERGDMTPEFIAAIVRNGISVMPPFRKTEISDADLRALSAWMVTAGR